MGIYFFLKPDHEQVSLGRDVSNRLDGSVSLSAASFVGQLESTKADSSTSSKKSEASGTGLTPKEHQELKNWLSDRGYDALRNIGDYGSYSEETLSKLAKTGDLKAIDLLIPKVMQRGEKDSAIRLMNTAVVYGSTVHLDDLTVYTAPDSTNNATEETRRPAVLETLALTKMMALRGDKSLSKVSQNSFLKSYKRLYNVDVSLSAEEQKLVDERAQEMYDSFQDVRTSIGLGDFDNSTPSGVDKFFGSSK